MTENDARMVGLLIWMATANVRMLVVALDKASMCGDLPTVRALWAELRRRGREQA